MISLLELRYGLIGAWRLLLRDPDALRYFDTSPAGFWRSFNLAILLAPGQAILVSLHLGDLGAPLDLRTILLEAGFYAIDWLLFPLLMVDIAARLQRSHRYRAYIVAGNYANAIGMLAWLAALALATVLPVAWGQALQLAVFILLVVYSVRIAAVALDLTTPPAFLLTLFSLGVSVVCQLLGDAVLLHGIFGPP